MRRTLASSIATLSLAALLALTGATPVAFAADEWSVPDYLSDGGQNGFGYQVTTDGATTTAVWVRNDASFDGPADRIQTARSSDGGATWSTAVTLSAPLFSAANPQVTTDGTTITVVWERWNGAKTIIEVSSSTDAGATWSTPQQLSPASGGTSGYPQVTTDGTRITAVWVWFDSLNNRIQSASSTDGGATWSTALSLPGTGLDAFFPQVVTNGTSITALWRFGVSVLTASSTDGGVSWIGDIFVSDADSVNTAFNPQLATDGTTITATWIASDGFYDRVKSSVSVDGGLNWSTPAYLSESGENAESPSVAAAFGVTTVSWLRPVGGGANRVQVASTTDAGLTWSAPQTISSGVQLSVFPRVASNGRSITVTWAQVEDAVYRIRAASSIDDGASWSIPVDLSEAGDNAYTPQIAADGRTTAVVWARADGVTERVQVSVFEASPVVSRLAGADRYATAVAISSEFAPGVPVVYLATGTNFPDALSAASAAAFQGGPLLLTKPGELPTIVRDELTRLNPSLVVIVGATGSVSATVEAQVVSLLPGATVRRDAGADRFATSRAIATLAFPVDVTTSAFIATGANFPDALSASAAAGAAGVPVILVDGRGSGIDTPTQSLLTSLGVERVFIAGGTGVVSATVANALESLLGASNVVRLAGTDRYSTSVAINAPSFDDARTVFLATGYGYADALAGGALAGVVGAPLFLVPGTCVPPAVLSEIDRLRATRIVLLGGTGSLSVGVSTLTSC